MMRIGADWNAQPPGSHAPETAREPVFNTPKSGL